MTFEKFWDNLQARLKPGVTINNWTADKGLLGDTFMIEKVSAEFVDVHSDTAETIQHVRKPDFKSVYDVWDGYLSKQTPRKFLRDQSRYTKYTISIIKYLQENSGKPAYEYNLSRFTAIPEPDLVEAYRNQEFDSFAERILKVMARLGGNGKLVTRNQLKAEIGRKKGWSRIMVALAATGYIELVHKDKGLHHYRLLRDPFSPDDSGYEYIANDIEAPDPQRVETTVNRIVRDTVLARRVKEVNGNQCQICGFTIVMPNGSLYSEAHHIKPLGKPHNGPDIEGNILVLCPNHHAMCDLGVISLDLSELRLVQGHQINPEYIDYHNSTLLVELK